MSFFILIAFYRNEFWKKWCKKRHKTGRIAETITSSSLEGNMAWGQRLCLKERMDMSNTRKGFVFSAFSAMVCLFYFSVWARIPWTKTDFNHCKRLNETWPTSVVTMIVSHRNYGEAETFPGIKKGTLVKGRNLSLNEYFIKDIFCFHRKKWEKRFPLISKLCKCLYIDWLRTNVFADRSITLCLDPRLV